VESNRTFSETRAPRKGIAPRLLIEQVRNTAPYVFTEQDSDLAAGHLQTIRESAARLRAEPEAELDPLEYFRLCLAAHWTTVATFVPTDVDVHIRFKLWNPALPIETLVAMAELVLSTRGVQGWDSRVLSRRFVTSPRSGRVISGHDGEWFSVAAAAYGALRSREADTAARLAAAILEEVWKQAEVYEEIRETGDGLEVLRCATLIAHNLGDLNRVIEQWNLPSEDPLREAVYQVGHEEEGRLRRGALAQAGQASSLSQALMINKRQAAVENHRHFALRGPRCLRRSPKLLLGIGPFFDDWGRLVARELSPEGVGEVAHALIAGWEKLPGTIGYPRALAGMIEAFPGGLNELCHYLPARQARAIKSGALRQLSSVPRSRFEAQWASIALHLA
jgi:hypothetical protein